MSIITKTFTNLDTDKQRKIINAALKEFAEKGYDHASTNTIVEKAGIGKGMLFYYFGNKSSLYYYLIEFSITVIEEGYYDLIQIDERDLIKRLKTIAQVKMDFLEKYPNTMDFFTTVFLNNFEDLNDKLKSRIIALQKRGYTDIYGNVEYSLFRDDIDIKKAIDLIRWSLNGFEEDMKYRLINQEISSLNYELMWEELYTYLDTMKDIFYKKEENVN